MRMGRGWLVIAKISLSGASPSVVGIRFPAGDLARVPDGSIICSEVIAQATATLTPVDLDRIIILRVCPYAPALTQSRQAARLRPKPIAPYHKSASQCLSPTPTPSLTGPTFPVKVGLTKGNAILGEVIMAEFMSEPLAKDFTLSNGLNMRYYHWPSTGPNLVLLHPSSGYGRMWDTTARSLQGQLQVYALDQRGHGDTDRPDGGYDAEEYAEDLHLFLEGLGLERTIIAGHSLGGRVAQVFAGTYPERCTAIILVGGPHYSNFFQERHRVNAVLEGAERMRVSQSEFPDKEAALAYLRTFRPNDSEEARGNRVGHNTRSLPGGGLAFKYDKVRVAQGLAHMADNLSPYAERVACPVAILRGTHSTHLTRDEAERIAPFWGDSRIIEVEGDYALQLENPSGLGQAIQAFTLEAALA